MTLSRFIRYLIGSVALASFAGFAAIHFVSTIDPRGIYFTEEPSVRDILNLSGESPKVLVSGLLEQEWEQVCVTGPYNTGRGDPALEGVDIPWGHSESFYTVVLLREGSFDLHKIQRSKVIDIQLEGLNEEQACFESTAVIVEFSERDQEGRLSLRFRETSRPSNG